MLRYFLSDISHRIIFKETYVSFPHRDGSLEKLLYSVRLNTLNTYVGREMTCADPESFVRRGLTLTFFFFGGGLMR